MLILPFPCLNDHDNVAQEAENDKTAQKDVPVMPNLKGKLGGVRGQMIQADVKLSDFSNSKSEQQPFGGKIVLIAPVPDVLHPVPAQVCACCLRVLVRLVNHPAYETVGALI